MTEEKQPKPHTTHRKADQSEGKKDHMDVNMSDVVLIGQALIGEGRFYFANGKRGLGAAKAFAGELVLRNAQRIAEQSQGKVQVVGPEAMPKGPIQ